MKTLITGERGFLGANLLKRWDSHNINTLSYNRYCQTKYGDLEKYKNSSVQIIHCGAASSRNNISKNTFCDNLNAPMQLIEFVEQNKKSRLIYISANSVGHNRHEQELNDIYSYTKYTIEKHIEKHICEHRYAIIRMPGIYSRGMQKNGFIDTLAYLKNYSRENLIIRHKDRFNNMICIDDAVSFIRSITNLDSLPGYIGSCGTEKDLSMEEVCRIMLRYNPKLASLIEFEKEEYTLKEPYKIDKAIELGLQRRATVNVIESLYGNQRK